MGTARHFGKGPCHNSMERWQRHIRLLALPCSKCRIAQKCDTPARFQRRALYPNQRHERKAEERSLNQLRILLLQSGKHRLGVSQSVYQQRYKPQDRRLGPLCRVEALLPSEGHTITLSGQEEWFLQNRIQW